jgi:hypothetical protein
MAKAQAKSKKGRKKVFRKKEKKIVLNGIVFVLPDGAATLGEIVDGRPGQVTLVGSNGEETVVSRAGWDHFG